jgi:hypothetical protein
MKKVFATLMTLSTSVAVFAAGTNTTDSSSNNGLAVVGFFVVLVGALVIPAIRSNRKANKAS